MEDRVGINGKFWALMLAGKGVFRIDGESLVGGGEGEGWL